ncbi:hypothetical protein EDD75_0310 [Thermodesulfitimonas autotrophica]|uniref:Uncharacterized protein n=1 Tax=Thermodesulfitimonas autotrophica TaxID=1894989 RepID=A0A3N5AWX9_9THEO|nr:hypothetical protein [Thermodesulfitimonas autotrophica]RPF49494.1 hypothetical protein EDD75_0310 [Thermodesulfitimonas autotrophica]
MFVHVLTTAVERWLWVLDVPPESKVVPYFDAPLWWTKVGVMWAVLATAFYKAAAGTYLQKTALIASSLLTLTAVIDAAVGWKTWRDWS